MAMPPGHHSQEGSQDCSVCPVPPKPDSEDDWARFASGYCLSNQLKPSASSSRCANSQVPGQGASTERAFAGPEKSRLAFGSAEVVSFYDRHGYLPAPAMRQSAQRQQLTNLNLYGISDGIARVSLQRYVKHAVQVFNTSTASIAIPTLQSSGVPTCSSVHAGDDAGTRKLGGTEMSERMEAIVHHCMMLQPDQAIVVEDTSKDWRFARNPCIADSMTSVRFFAGVPLRVCVSDEASRDKITIGALFIADSQPRPGFDKDRVQLLHDIAAMAAEALEAEFYALARRKQEKMQSMFTQLSDLLWSTTLNFDSSALDTTAPHQAQADSTVRVISECLEASASIIDVTNFTQSMSDPVGIHRAANLGNSNVHTMGSKPPSPIRPTVPPMRPPLQSWSSNSSAGWASQSSETSFSSPTTSVASYSHSSRTSLHSRMQSFSGASGSLDGGDNLFLGPAFVFAHCGSMPSPTVDSPEQRSAIAGLLATLRREREEDASTAFDQMAGPFSISSEASGLGAETDSFQDELTHESNPLAPLFTDVAEAGSYVAVPITWDSQRAQATFLLLVTFPTHAAVSKPDRTFIHHCCRLLMASLTRQQAYLADSRQLDFVRSVQHEMRTPINGIAGIADLLRSSVENDGPELDTHPDGLLSTALDGIRMSASNISSVLDDILDFGDLSGIRPSAGPARLDETDLAALVEEVGLEELEIAAIALRHEAKVSAELLDVTPPEFIVTVDPSAAGRFRMDRLSMRKICRKLLHNCFRFTSRCKNKGALVEVAIKAVTPADDEASYSSGEEVFVSLEFKDSGRGMSKEFVENKYAVSFQKEDTFKQGTGLGATIAADLTQRLGGSFHIESHLGEGTKVRVTLPLIFVSQTDDDITALDETVAPKSPAVSKAFFSGFADTLGESRLRQVLEAYLHAMDISIVDAAREADLLVLPMRSLLGPTTDGVLTSSPWDRVIAVSADPLQRCSRLSGIIAAPFRVVKPPFGPGHLAGLGKFLREPMPTCVPSPSSTAASPGGATAAPSQAIASGPISIAQAQLAPSSPKSHVVNSVPSDLSLKAAPEAGRPPSSISLPSADQPSPAELTPSAPLASSPPVDTFRVLAVEDNPTNMKILTVVLQRGGFDYCEARDGREAIAKFKSYQPHLVLLDISLPLADGFEVCAEMRAFSLPHRPLIVAVTALSSKADQKRGLDLGMDEWRTKPLSPRVLVKCLQEWKAAWDLERSTAKVSPSETVMGGGGDSSQKSSPSSETAGGPLAVAGAALAEGS